MFHNPKGYDSHLIVRAYKGYINGKGERAGDISVIANTDEKYMTFEAGGFQFKDSLQHLPTSLASLVNALDGDTPYLKGEYPDHSKLLARKGVYPYEYMTSIDISMMTSFDKFDETRLPPIEAFASSLNNGATISQEDYEHAQLVWKVMKCKTLGDYHDLYLTSDVMLLADVSENYRKMSLENYGLDPLHYLTSASLSWDAMLKTTDQGLELTSDVDMYNFIERSTRGGVSTPGSMRLVEANNPYLPNYNPEKRPPT